MMSTATSETWRIWGWAATTWKESDDVSSRSSGSNDADDDLSWMSPDQARVRKGDLVSETQLAADSDDIVRSQASGLDASADRPEAKVKRRKRVDARHSHSVAAHGSASGWCCSWLGPMRTAQLARLVLKHRGRDHTSSLADPLHARAAAAWDSFAVLLAFKACPTQLSKSSEDFQEQQFLLFEVWHVIPLQKPHLVSAWTLNGLCCAFDVNPPAENVLFQCTSQSAIVVLVGDCDTAGDQRSSIYEIPLSETAQDDQGTLLGLSSNQAGQPSSLSDVAHPPVACQASISASVVQLSCGKSHVALLDNVGRVWTFGRNAFGQLGHGTVSDTTTPSVVEGLEGLRMVDISCGGWHTLVRSEAGDVYSFGRNSNGQLGRPTPTVHNREECESAHAPALVVTDHFDKDVSFVAVACGASHTVLLDSAGGVFGCGDKSYGQLLAGPDSQGAGSDTLQHPWQLIALTESGSKVRCIQSGHSAWYTLLKGQHEQPTTPP